MKPFNEYIEDEKMLDEGIVRTGSVVTLAARSIADGKKAEKSYKRGLTVLDRQIDREGLVAQLEQLNEGLKALLEGQLYQLRQSNNHVGLDAVGHLAKKKSRR